MLDHKTLPILTDFFRFVVAWHSGSKKRQLGVLRTAGYLLDTQETSYDDERALRDLVHWFNRNLTAPTRLDRVAAIFWFKPHVADGTELWGKLSELIKLLQKYRRVEIVCTARPGKIVYDDTVQVAAVPFKDTFEAGRVAVINRPA